MYTVNFLLRVYKILLVILLLIIGKVVSVTDLENKLQTEAFIYNFIHGHLSECFIIHIHNNDFHLDTKFSKFPVIDVHLGISSTTSNFLRNFNTRKQPKFVKFQEQCIVFIVNIMKDEKGESNKSINQLAKIFLHRKFQSQSPQSYIFITDYNENAHRDENAKDILIHPALYNYEHKIWIHMIKKKDVESLELNKSQNKKRIKFLIHHFCNFCKDGPLKITTQKTITVIYKQKTNYNNNKNKNNNEEDEDDYEKRKFPMKLEEIFPDMTNDLQGRALHVTTAMALPFAGILGSKAAGNLRMEGMQAIVLECVSTALNFTFILENTSGGLTGSRFPNGSWSGTIGEVHSGRSDFGLNVATSLDRYAIADFTVPAYYGFLVLVSTKPSPFFAWKAIFYPFEVKAWLGIIASTFFTVLAYRFFLNQSVARMLKNESRKAQNQNKKEPKKRRKPKYSKVSFIKVCYITFGSLLEQGVPFDYFATPAKIYALFWLLFTMVATCAYKSKLFSYLTFPIIQIPPSSFRELSVSDYSWGMRSLGGIAMLFITKSPISYIRDVGEKMDISYDKYSCIDKTFTDRFVCIMYSAYYDYMSHVRYWKINHKFHVSDYVTPPVGSAWVLPKNSPLLHPINDNIFRQFEMGLSAIYLEHYIKEMALKTRKSVQASKDQNEVFELNTIFKRNTIKEKPLEFSNLYAGFLILFFGSGLSTTLLLCELWRHDHKRPEDKQRDNVVKNLRRVRLEGAHFFRRKRPLGHGNRHQDRIIP